MGFVFLFLFWVGVFVLFCEVFLCMYLVLFLFFLFKCALEARTVLETPAFRKNEAGRYIRVDPFIMFDKF